MAKNNTLDADAFGKRKLILNGAEFHFRPATIRDQLEYLTPNITPRIEKALSESDTDERYRIMIEVIRRIAPDIPEDELLNCTDFQLNRIYFFVLNGVMPVDEEDEEKNF